MEMLSKNALRKLRSTYPEGTCVELLEMRDPQAPPAGTKGVVVCVDDAGTIHTRWENGSSLGLIPEEDEFRIVEVSHESSL